MEAHLKILLVSDDEVIHNQILNAVSGSYTVQLINSREVVREVNRDVQDIVIFVQPEGDIAVESIQYIKSISPSTLVIFIAKGSDFTLLRNITKAGASEFFVYPEEYPLFINRVPAIFQNYEVNKLKKMIPFILLQVEEDKFFRCLVEMVGAANQVLLRHSRKRSKLNRRQKLF